jgi:hypothetical protein
LRKKQTNKQTKQTNKQTKNYERGLLFVVKMAAFVKISKENHIKSI